MSKQTNAHVARLQQDVPAAEISIFDAMIAVSTLTTNVLAARRDTPRAPVAKGHAAIRRLINLQSTLADASGDALRIHADLADIAKETAGYDLHECPSVAGTNVVPISQAG